MPSSRDSSSGQYTLVFIQDVQDVPIVQRAALSCDITGVRKPTLRYAWAQLVARRAPGLSYQLIARSP